MCGEEALSVVLPAQSWGVLVHFGDLADAAGGLCDGVFEHALDLGGSRLLEKLGDGQNFLGMLLIPLSISQTCSMTKAGVATGSALWMAGSVLRS